MCYVSIMCMACVISEIVNSDLIVQHSVDVCIFECVSCFSVDVYGVCFVACQR